MKELEAILTLRDGNNNSSPCSLSIYYTSTCYFCKASQQLYEVAATISMLQKKKWGLIGLRQVLEHKVGFIPQGLGSLHHTSQCQDQTP